MDKYVQILSDVSELSEIKDARGGKIRNRYVLVAVRSPDHHGLFVGDLAGGDGVDLLDVLDLGNGLHGDNFYVSAIYDEWSAYAFLKSFLENFSFFFWLWGFPKRFLVEQILSEDSPLILKGNKVYSSLVPKHRARETFDFGPLGLYKCSIGPAGLEKNR